MASQHIQLQSQLQRTPVPARQGGSRYRVVGGTAGKSRGYLGGVCVLEGIPGGSMCVGKMYGCVRSGITAVQGLQQVREGAVIIDT